MRIIPYVHKFTRYVVAPHGQKRPLFCSLENQELLNIRCNLTVTNNVIFSTTSHFE